MKLSMFGDINNYIDIEKLRYLSLDHPLNGYSNLCYVYNYIFNKNKLKRNELYYDNTCDAPDFKLFLNIADFYFKHIFLKNSKNDVFNHFESYFNDFLNTLCVELVEIYSVVDFPKETIFKEIEKLVYINNPELLIASE